MRKYNLPIFIPHRGCPHDCVFCNQRKITGVETEVTLRDVREKIQLFLSTVNMEDASVEVAFFGGSFTGLEMSTQEAFLSVAAEFYPAVSGIRISTRPDYITEDILDLLKRYGVTTIELGVQSSDDEVLRMNNRGHSFDDVKNASGLIRRYGIDLGHQMMLGMYGSDPEKDMKTVRDIIELHPSCVRIYPVITLKDTALEKYYSVGEYTPYTLEQAAELCCAAVKLFRGNNIEVIRMGLHASEDLEENNAVAGPYHPAFGEIVESLIYREKIEQAIVPGEKICEFRCPERDISKAVGHKQMNKKYIWEKYGVELKVSAI